MRGRNYCHINPNGDVEPCVFIHYSGANIKEASLLDAPQTAAFMAYRNHQPFNCNHLKPCPMLENPELLQQMVHETGAKPRSSVTGNSGASVWQKSYLREVLVRRCG